MKPTAESVTEGVDLSGKTALVTGATSGLGRECARVLALRGARVIIACRDPQKGRAVIDAMGEHGASCEAAPCELTSMRSVRALADSLERADLLFLNAGVFGLPFALTDEGLERTFAANFLGHFLLMHRLLARGALAPGARIVATLSEGVLNPLVKVDLALLGDPSANARRYSTMGASPATKVLLARVATELSRRAEGITFNSVLPAATLTDNVNQGGAIARAIGPFIGPLLFARVEHGAAVLAWAATSRELAGQTAKAFSSKLREVRLPKRCTDPKLARETWDAAERALGLDPWHPAGRNGSKPRD